MQLHPNLEIRKAIPKVKKLGCSVENKHRHGEIVFTHPLIDIPYVISNNKDGIGKGFISWLKPVIQEKKEYLLEKNKSQYPIAYVIYYNTKLFDSTTSARDIIKFYNEEPLQMTKKQVSDILSQLARKKLIKRIRIGEYKSTEELDIFFQTQEKNNAEKTVQNLEHDVELLCNEDSNQSFETNNDNEILENKPEENINQFLEKENSMLREHVDLLTQRFETCVNKLEKLTERLEETEEVKDAVKIMEDIFQKRCLTR